MNASKSNVLSAELLVPGFLLAMKLPKSNENFVFSGSIKLLNVIKTYKIK